MGLDSTDFSLPLPCVSCSDGRKGIHASELGIDLVFRESEAFKKDMEGYYVEVS